MLDGATSFKIICVLVPDHGCSILSFCFILFIAAKSLHVYLCTYIVLYQSLLSILDDHRFNSRKRYEIKRIWASLILGVIGTTSTTSMDVLISNRGNYVLVHFKRFNRMKEDSLKCNQQGRGEIPAGFVSVCL